MKRFYSFLFLWILFLCTVFSSPNFDALPVSYQSVTPEKYVADFYAPGRRSLLSDATKGRETALVPAMDGRIYLVDVGSLKPLWSFSSGKEIYSSYQAPIDDKENVSGIESSHFIDCGEDGELYAHHALGPPQKLMTSVEEYVNSTPQILEGGGIVLGSKTTTAFLIDAKSGRIMNKYKMSDSSHYHANDLPYNVTMNKKHQSGSDMATDELPLYITRTDYGLTSFIPNSNKVLWNMTVAEITASLLCEGVDNSFDVILLDSKSSEPGLPYNMPLSCQSRIRVFPFHNSTTLESSYMPKMLPKAYQQHMLPPSSTSEAIPPERGSVTFRGKFSKYLWVLVSVSLLILITFHRNLISKTKLNLAEDSTGTNRPKKKRSRKSGKGENKTGKPDKEENDINHTQKENKSNFWVNLDQPICYGSAGRRIGKLFVSSEQIAKGSNGTIIVEGIYQGRPVAVKRLVRSHNDIAVKEIENLIVSDRHPNIIRWYGVEQDNDFVYLALERCTCSLNDLILMHMKDSGISIVGNKSDPKSVSEITLNMDSMKGVLQGNELWKSDGCPSPLLLKLMRDVISGIAHLHELGIVHRDLKPQNVLIIGEGSLYAKVSDMGISKRLVGDMSSFSNHATGSGSSGWQAPEQLLHGRQTRAVDMFSLGCVLFFCITGGKHPFGDRLERDSNIAKSKLDLFLVESIPEAVDLFLQLLHPDAEMRPKALEVLCHPLFWNAEMRLSFLHDTSDRVELEDREIHSQLLKDLESVASVALGANWNEKMEPSFLNNIGRYRRYKYDSIRDLLRVMRNKLNHFRELPSEIQEVIGPVPEGFDRYFSSRFPKLLIEVYKVVLLHSKTEEWFAKYFKAIED